MFSAEKTVLICQNPLTVYYPVPPFTNEDMVRRRVDEAKKVIGSLLEQADSFNLLLDFRGFPETPEGYNLNAHRTWSAEFKYSPMVQEHVEHAALLGNDSPQFRAERELMETERMKFFTDEDEAHRWLGVEIQPSGCGFVD